MSAMLEPTIRRTLHITKLATKKAGAPNRSTDHLDYDKSCLPVLIKVIPDRQITVGLTIGDKAGKQLPLRIPALANTTLKDSEKYGS